jgi:hypothetical protein
MMEPVYQLFEMRGDGDMKPIGSTYPTALQCLDLRNAVVTVIRKVLPDNPENLGKGTLEGGAVRPILAGEFDHEYGIYRKVDDGWEQIEEIPPHE